MAVKRVPILGTGDKLATEFLPVLDADDVGAADKTLSNLTSAAAARDALELGSAALLDVEQIEAGSGSVVVGTTAGTVAAGNDQRIVGAAQKSANLGDLTNVAIARINLQLGSAALLDANEVGGGGTVTYGTTAGTAAQGNDSRIVGAAQKAANLSDLTNAGTARTNLGLGAAATLAVGTTSSTVAAGNAPATAQAAAIAVSAQRAANLADLANVATARTNLGLGTSATRAVGTTAGTVAAGDDPRFGSGGGPSSTALAAHEADTTNIHGIADTTLLETKAGAQTKATAAQSAAATALAAHEADTTAVHGIPNTAVLETVTGSQAKATAAQNASVANVGGGKEGYAAVTVAAGTYTLNLAAGNVQQLLLQANTTLTLTGATNATACSVSLYLVQDATGGRTVTWPTSVKWAGGSRPTLTMAGGARDLIVLETLTGGTVWYASAAGLDFK